MRQKLIGKVIMMVGMMGILMTREKVYAGGGWCDTGCAGSIYYNGNVGIGAVVTPSSLLHIRELSGSKPGGVVSPTKSVLKLSRDGTTNYSYNESAEFRIGHGGPSVWGSKLDLYINGGSNITDIPDQHVMTWNYDGNVGIGTTNPGAKLDISGGNGTVFNQWTYSPEPTVYNLKLIQSVENSNVYWNFVQRNLNWDYNVLTFRLGSVGIGTTNPTRAKLESAGIIGNTNAIFGSDQAGVSLINNWPGIYFNGYWNGGPKSLAPGYGGSIWFSPEDGHFELRTTNNPNGSNISFSESTKFTILNSGSVGIGTANPDPAYKLSVNGAIRTKDVIVETGWADYVFAPGYKLLPLEKLEEKIKAEKHLPGIPSAAEVKEKGVSLAEMQTKMLEKVEELTLYVIELKKELAEMKK